MAGSPQHATLVANTVTTLTFDAAADEVEVTSVDGIAAVYFTANGVDPVLGATGTEVVPAAVGAWTTAKVPGSPVPTIIKLRSSGIPKVSVRTS